MKVNIQILSNFENKHSFSKEYNICELFFSSCNTQLKRPLYYIQTTPPFHSLPFPITNARVRTHTYAFNEI